MNQEDMIKAENGKPCMIGSKGTILIKPEVDVDT